MTEFLLYTGRSGLYLGIFYAFYLLVMRRTTFFRLNRIVLLLGSFACALLPLIRVRTTTLVAVAGYTLVSALLLHRHMAGGTLTRINGFRTVIMSDDLPSFTFGKTIFISRKDLEQHPAILTHEAMHVSNRHYLDLFLFCAIQILWWWNPLVWIMRTELGLLHEVNISGGCQRGRTTRTYPAAVHRKCRRLDE